MMKQCRYRLLSPSPQPDLPQEIVFDILVRLPVKSVLRFKSVCKSWLCLISDPMFVQSHLDTTNKRLLSSASVESLTDPERHGVLYSDVKPRPSLNFISFTTTDGGGSDCESVAKEEEVVVVSNNTNRTRNHPMGCCDLNILGSCNGLLFVDCVSSGDHFLWNPCTGESKKIFSRSECPLIDSKRKNFHMSGFGYDSSKDEYKAIIIFRTSPMAFWGRPREEVAVSIYSCKLGSCSSSSGGGGGGGGNGGSYSMKYITEFPYFIGGRSPSVNVNGVNGGATPHWVEGRLMPGYGSDYLAIIYYDEADESFKEVSRPDSFSKSSDFNLAVLGGCLCVVDDIKPGKFLGFDVWAMKEYGVKDSWTKLFVIHSAVSSLHLLGFTKSGEVLIHVDAEHLVTYNVHTGAWFQFK